LGKERAVARGTVVAVGGSAMGETASSFASCRGLGCSSSGSSARRRGEIGVGLRMDRHGLNGDENDGATTCGLAPTSR